MKRIEIDFENKTVVVLDDMSFSELSGFLSLIPGGSDYKITSKKDSCCCYHPYYQPWYPQITYCGTGEYTPPFTITTCGETDSISCTNGSTFTPEVKT